MFQNLSDKKKVIAINAILFGVLFGVVSFNKEVLRSGATDNSFMQFITGVFPNFIAAFILELSIMISALIRTQKPRFLTYIGGVFLFLVFTVEEYASVLGASEHADKFDVLASGVGVLLVFVFFETILFMRKRRKK